MDINHQIIISLLIIITIQTALHIITILKLKWGQVVQGGLEIGDKIPNVDFNNVDGDIKGIYDNVLGNKNTLVFLDLDCKECNKVFSSLDVFNISYLSEIKLVLIKTEKNFKYMSNSVYKDRALFIDEDIIINQFNIDVFPFAMRVDESGKVEENSHITKENLINYIT
ncbi:hypothetical protein CN936_19260 [Bacillus cereus]|uniref:hypothetical protein n=1 Tax=Bacillus cereus TaxID=1396 RepID=UPI000BECF2BD|nr:hypothetical protein [Bacillus cereus]MEB8688159.1 hypothetical protein [Bacillus cereus]PEE92520.1 hypothetical protein COM92_23885 [Bacillus cereus]PFO69528.1 hypothetical protein COJ83_10015 [Bacillus cereus]PFR80716.1 hypothetical protein COK29_06515 [Bacillus cereus]PGL93060.1 hypothetical protein CN936_19260 [Bacillus cereus]